MREIRGNETQEQKDRKETFTSFVVRPTFNSKKYQDSELSVKHTATVQLQAIAFNPISFQLQPYFQQLLLNSKQLLILTTNCMLTRLNFIN